MLIEGSEKYQRHVGGLQRQKQDLLRKPRAKVHTVVHSYRLLGRTIGTPTHIASTRRDLQKHSASTILPDKAP